MPLRPQRLKGEVRGEGRNHPEGQSQLTSFQLKPEALEIKARMYKRLIFGMRGLLLAANQMQLEKYSKEVGIKNLVQSPKRSSQE